MVGVNAHAVMEKMRETPPVPLEQLRTRSENPGVVILLLA